MSSPNDRVVRLAQSDERHNERRSSLGEREHIKHADADAGAKLRRR